MLSFGGGWIIVGYIILNGFIKDDLNIAGLV